MWEELHSRDIEEDDSALGGASALGIAMAENVQTLKEIYKNKDRTTFPNRAAVERLHVEFHAKHCTVSSNQLCM